MDSTGREAPPLCSRRRTRTDRYGHGESRLPVPPPFSRSQPSLPACAVAVTTLSPVTSLLPSCPPPFPSFLNAVPQHYPQPNPPAGAQDGQLQQTSTIRNAVNLKKDSLKLVPRPGNPDILDVYFKFDSTALCRCPPFPPKNPHLQIFIYLDAPIN